MVCSLCKACAVSLARLLARWLRTVRVMRKRIFIAAAILLVGFIISPIPLRSQTRLVFTRTALSKMDVLSRAALFEEAIAEAAQKEGVDPLILWTIAYNETRFRPWLTSPRRAQGLMQFIPATAARFGLANPYEPNASIYAAARYVKYLRRLFDGRLESVLAAYNSGEGTVLAFLHGRTLATNGKRINPAGRRTIDGVPPYRETISYVANGKRIYRWLEAQGKFPGIKKGSTPDAPAQTFASDREPSQEKSRAGTSAITVLYDPRTGNRHLVDSHGRLTTMDDKGPVVISSGVRGLPAQKARSIFAGLPR